MIPRKKRNSSKVNLVISVVFHTLLVVGLVLFAASQGTFGKKMQALTATLVPKEKKPEPPKEKPPEPKIEPPKLAAAPRPAAAPPKAEVAPPPSEVASVAPPQVNLPSFEFSDGAKDVQSVSDPVEIYKSLVEQAFRANWKRPNELDDGAFKADVELNLDAKGRVLGHRWVNGSGNTVWDESVKSAVAQTKAVSQPPPKGFPGTFIVRFDVATMAAENTLQFGSPGTQ